MTIKHSPSKQNRYRVIIPIAVTASSPKEAIEKVNAMLTTGTYKGKFLKYVPYEGTESPEVKKL